jgi:hypothetical protein
MANARAYAVCAAALISRPVISKEITVMPSAVVLPELAVVKVSLTICAVPPLRWRFVAITAPKPRRGLNPSANA